MKKNPLPLLISGLALAVALALRAQTNAPPAGPVTVTVTTNAIEGSTNEGSYMDIQANHLVGRIEDHMVITVLDGNVRVDDPQLKLTCERLTARQPENGGRFTNIVAEFNVVINAVDENGKPVHATGEKAVYTVQTLNAGGLSERVVLTGGNGSNAVVRSQMFSGTAPTIIMTRVNGTNGFEMNDPNLRIRIPTQSATNAPAKPKTNAPAL